MELQTAKKTAQTIKAWGQKYILSELNLNSLKSNDLEKKILQLRLTGISVCDTPENELSVLTEVAIFRISAISGFSLPTSEKFADILNEEFMLLIREFGYSELTYDEIITAFRINAKGYRFESGYTIKTITPYSSFFSINYASAVLENYMEIRRTLDSKITQAIDSNTSDIFKKYEK